LLATQFISDIDPFQQIEMLYVIKDEIQRSDPIHPKAWGE